MTPEELQELRDWAARKMGWVEKQYGYDWCYYLGTKYDRGDGYEIEARTKMTDWLPDRPESGQIWMLVERMRELGWEMKLGYGDTIQGVLCWVRFTKESYSSYYHNSNPCLAILKAARATEEEWIQL